MCKLDLKNAYHSIRVHSADRPYLCFRHPETQTLYRYTCLPFGLSDAPRAFTKVLAPVVTQLRSQGAQVISYLDDWLLMSSKEPVLVDICKSAVHLLEGLNFAVNRAKSQLQPSKQIEFLGCCSTRQFSPLCGLKRRQVSVRHECRCILRHGTISETELRCLLGKMEASRIAVKVAPLHFRGLQFLLQDLLMGKSDWGDTFLCQLGHGKT